MKFPFTALCLTLAAACAQPAAARDVPVTIEIGDSAKDFARPAFSGRDRERIRDYYSRRSDSLPPGLAKKRHLPPGLQKQLERNGRLPPGLEKRALPNDLERRLSRLPGGYSRVIVGRDVVLIQTSTQQILDILNDVVN
jgi:hypothetical protein